MANTINIRRGLNIPIKGKAPETIIGNIKTDIVRIYPEDFAGLIPKVNVKIGDKVKIGTPLMYEKNNPQILFTSPVSGEVVAVERGEKRRLLNIVISCDNQHQTETFNKKDVTNLSADEIKDDLLKAGLWVFIKQRPYDVIADPKVTPRDIFISGFSSAPLAPSFDFIIEKEVANFQTGLDALAKLTTGNVYLGISPETKLTALKEAKNVKTVIFDGPHPAGNVGVQINQLKPVNKGEVVWTLSALDVVLLGHLFNEGALNLTRLVAYTGSEAVKKGYYRMVIGSDIAPLVVGNTTKNKSLRCISGNVLSGTKIKVDGSLRFYDSQVTVIPEGDDKNDMLGWAMPGLNKYSAGNTYLSQLMSKLGIKKEYNFDSRILGGKRAIIMSNQYDKVFPMDIMPEYLIKATIAFNLDKMEQLGIYEVAPEDFALCEFVDTSKLEIQQIIRTGLLKFKQEME